MQPSDSSERTAPAPTVIGIVIGKDVFHVVGFDADGKIVLRRKIKRLALADTFRKLPTCTVGMEACLGTRKRDGQRRASHLPGGRHGRLRLFSHHQHDAGCYA